VQLRSLLKLDGFELEDVDIDFPERYFWFYFTNSGSDAEVDDFTLWFEPSCTTALYRKYLDVLSFDKETLDELAKEIFGSDSADIDYQVEYDEEAKAIQLHVWADSLEDLPDVKSVSRLFSKIVLQNSKEDKKGLQNNSWLSAYEGYYICLSEDERLKFKSSWTLVVCQKIEGDDLQPHTG